MGVRGRLAGLGTGGLAGLWAATQFVAWDFRWPAVFGSALALSPDLKLYWPWSYVIWRTRFGAHHPEVWSGGIGHHRGPGSPDWPGVV